ncbi:hypothetical protein JXI42_12015 [bacterium]|nr:hypothetical protein [bacterium]
MLTVKCAKCNGKIFRYHKIGKGRLLRCWLDRIIKDYSVRDGDEVRCRCGSLIGTVEGKSVKMKQNSFTYSGTKTSK